MGQITIVGLGPGDFGLITLDTWDKITNTDKLILRTAIHPTVAELDKRNVVYTSCDEFYEQGASFDDVYNSIAQKLIEEAKNGHDVVYAVPGSPLVAERTVVIIRQKAKEAGVKLNIMPGMSFMEVLSIVRITITNLRAAVKGLERGAGRKIQHLWKDLAK